MTPSEKIIVRFYSANTFMYNNQECNEIEKNKVYNDIQRALEYEGNVNYSVQQIRDKWQYLCDSFITATKKVEKKETLTYLENSLYQRLFFLKSFIISKKAQEDSMLLQNYDYKNNVKVNGTAATEMLNEVQQLLMKNNNKIVSLESASMFNEIILSHKNERMQRLYLNLILKSIKTFITACEQK